MIQYCLQEYIHGEHYHSFDGWSPIAVFLTKKDAYNYFLTHLQHIRVDKRTYRGHLVSFDSVPEHMFSYAITYFKVGELGLQFNFNYPPNHWFLRPYSWVDSIEEVENPNQLFLSRYFYNTNTNYPEWIIKLKYRSEIDKQRYFENFLHFYGNVKFVDDNTIILESISANITPKRNTKERLINTYEHTIQPIFLDDSIENVEHIFGEVINREFTITTVIKIK